jgi:acetyltransferase-like isoleucine patch superfamily enzyme
LMLCGRGRNMNKKEIREIFDAIRQDPELQAECRSIMIELFDLRKNPFHPLVFINGTPEFGKGTCVGFFSEINAKGGRIVIGDSCDIASFVSINVADSHKACIGILDTIQRGTIILGDHVFIGSHSFIGGNTSVGHHSVIAAGTILINGGVIPPYSLVAGNPAKTKPGYYKDATSPA